MAETQLLCRCYCPAQRCWCLASVHGAFVHRGVSSLTALSAGAPVLHELLLCTAVSAARLLLILQVLLFCTMARVLDVLEDYLTWRGLQCLRLDGATASAERGALVQEFNRPGGFQLSHA